MNNSNRESTSFIYKKILSQLNPLNDRTISVTKECLFVNKVDS